MGDYTLWEMLAQSIKKMFCRHYHLIKSDGWKHDVYSGTFSEYRCMRCYKAVFYVSEERESKDG